jgi:hypothetical protein
VDTTAGTLWIPLTRSIMSRTDFTCEVRVLATHKVVAWRGYIVHMVCTRSLNWPCTRSAGIRDSSLAGDSLQRPISFRLGQVTDEVVSLLCPGVPEGTRCLSHNRASATHAGEGNRHTPDMGRPGCRGPGRTLAACRSAGAGARYEVVRVQGESPCSGVPKGRTLLLTWVARCAAGMRARHIQ